TVARSTVLKWLTAYRKSGGDIKSLQPQPRSDHGSSRSIDEESAAALIALKQELPECSLEALLTRLVSSKLSLFHAALLITRRRVSAVGLR
ncbi:MAG: hypothetical protein R6W94_10405, partial [Spirochaetia bacterium]